MAALQHVRRLDPSPATARPSRSCSTCMHDYRDASRKLFAAVDAGDDAAVQHYDHEVIDPVFGVLEDIVSRQAEPPRTALAHSASLRAQGARATRAITVAFGVGLVLLACFAAIILRFRRRLDAARAAELERLSEIAISDPLTGLRNHRAFHEDLARELQRVSRTGTRSRSCCSTSTTSRPSTTTSDTRPATSASGAGGGDPRHPARRRLRLPHRRRRVRDHARRHPRARRDGVRPAPARGDAIGDRVSFTVTAGIAEALELRAKDELVREADLALIGAKRIHQDVAIYGPDMEPGPARHRRGRAPQPHAGQRARPRRRRQGLLHPQPLPDGVAAVRGDRRRARPRRRPPGAHAPGRPAARRRQDRRAGRDPQQAQPAHRRRVRGDEAPLAAGLRHRPGRRHADRGAPGCATTTSASTAAATPTACAATTSRSSRASSSSPTRSRR